MPIAAVPKYLGTDFSEASPGLRFGLLLRIWTSREDQEAEVKKRAEAKSSEGQRIKEMLERDGIDVVIGYLHDENFCQQNRLKQLPGLWDKSNFAARRAWDGIRKLTPSDKERMQHLALRQAALAATVPADNLLHLEATALTPFTTGLGNEHPLENGFSFLWPYGLPYLPGSGVKGVLRQAARELASGEWGQTHGWSAEKNIPLMEGEGERRKPVRDARKRPVMLSLIDVLFGLESGDGDTEHVRGALSFWDVIPQIEGASLMVEIMTPHQSHYYQEKRERKTGDSVSPHDSGQPNPIPFLTIPPGSRFAFHVVCDRAHLARLAPDLIASDPAGGKPRWQVLLRAAFKHAFTWLGFGAKTAIGYGSFRIRKSSSLADDVEPLRHEVRSGSYPPELRNILEELERKDRLSIQDIDRAVNIISRNYRGPGATEAALSLWSRLKTWPPGVARLKKNSIFVDLLKKSGITLDQC